MTDFPDVKLKAVVQFPAKVLDGTGIDIIKSNGSYQFNLDFGDFAPPVLSLTDLSHQNLLLWNNITGQYALAAASVVITAIGASDSNPIVDGVAAPGIATSYARGDHVHPTDTSRAALASPTFTGDPKAPTPTAGDNDTSIATTAFVAAAIAAMVVKQQIFIASGTYTPSTGMRSCIIECQGGGGGGGGAAATAAGNVNGAGGGGGGEYSRIVSTAALVGASQTVTIGAAGAAGAAGNNIGGVGGTTSVGTLCTAGGGSAGSGAASGGIGGGGSGGQAGTGSLLWGATGQSGAVSTATTFQGRNSGAGGHSGWGRGGMSVSNAIGNTATGFGGGGSGASDFNGTSAKAGGAGTAGKVIITEFCTQ